ncbi:MAG: ABC transporter ATP-binding protein [Gammaproteobacteria bacterium]|nr:ABC transporter ATP-binding protein [Gammaproteobacteria bacterium]
MISLRGITKIFRLGEQDVHALAGIDLDIERGQYVSVMGPSGSGKSTLLNMIALLDRPTAGRYSLDGKDVTRLDDDTLARIRRENIGFVFQFFHLVPRLTAATNVEVPMLLAGVPAHERRKRVAATLEAFGLTDRAQHRPDQLSGGQRQRVAIARATIMQPQLVLADEPTGNLDQASGQTIIDLLEQLNAGGVTLLIVTHDAAIGGRARRRIRMVDGRIVEDASG